MSSKLLKQVIQRGDELDNIAASAGKKKRKVAKLKAIPKKEDRETVEKSVLQSQVETMLFFDTAFSNRSMSTNAALDRRQNSLLKKKSKKAKEQILGNSRSSASIHARKAHVPTFNKKKHAAQKKIKDLKELANMLKRDRKK
jgi:hypothetical protein